MKIGGRSLISVSLFIALYTGFQGGRYFFANRVQEIGILCVLALFIYGAVMTAFKTTKKE